MKIETVTSRMFQSQAYIVVCEETRKCVLIDTGEDGSGIADAFARFGLEPERVLLTHGHLDHAGGLAAVHTAFPEAQLSVHEDDVPLVQHVAQQGSMFGVSVKPPPVVSGRLTHGDTIQVGTSVRLRVIATPGHTPGGVTFYDEAAGVAFVGDTLFSGSIGRTDLPGGDTKQLLESIHEQLLVLPDAVRCYSGHGPVTSVGEERRTNPFLQPGVRLG